MGADQCSLAGSNALGDLSGDQGDIGEAGELVGPAG